MLLTAHSGSDGTPDNSRLFIEIMSELSISCIEVDVRKKENVLYLSHDSLETIDDCLTLTEAFQIIAEKPELSINCDLKESGLEKAVINLAEQFLIEDKVILSGSVNIETIPPSFSRENVFYNPENYIQTFYNEIPLNKNKLLVLINYCKHHYIKVINVHYKMATEHVINLLNQENIRLSVWTVNEFEMIDFFEANNLYNVTSKEACGYLYHKKKRRALSD